MNKIEETEIHNLKSDIISNAEEIEASKNIFAEELKDSIGEEIISSLKNNTAIKIDNGFKFRFKNFIKKIKSGIKFIIISE